MFDNLRDLAEKAGELAGRHGDAINQGLEKAGEFIDGRTEGKYSDHIDTGVEKAQGFVSGLGKDS
ncbi:antitoxin (plasmid) [Streptomyces sp. BI20]|uniref:antitoxin n=1 Tax=Streptomyces sp. BI20 TaxID=3403460 RepID=UPI003C79383F